MFNRLLFILLLCNVLPTRSSRAAEITLDGSKTIGQIRPLHSVNKGPLDAGGTIDLSAYFRDLRIPFVRLHDCHWPNPDVVDIHAIFPNPDADPSDPGSYDFVRTDAYLAAIHKTGARIVYRLGESIEHGPDKRRLRPPPDPQKWAQICLGIIRHYNEGWANGFRYDIPYWEIWNEPENRPFMWTGSDQDYIRLYVTAAKTIKAQFPHLKVGGPALGSTGTLDGASLKPTFFVEQFLQACRRQSAPLDFFSWHKYSDDPRLLAVRARAIRALLDAHGFAGTESHLNEYNYLPDNDWGPLLPAGQGKPRQKHYQRIAGIEGAAFIASALIYFQDSPLAHANLYAANAGDFGLFTHHGVPQKNFYAVKAFSTLLDTPHRLAVDGNLPAHTALLAGRSADKNRIALLLVNHRSPHSDFTLHLRNLPWTSRTTMHLLRLDAAHDLAPAPPATLQAPLINFRLESPSLVQIILQPAPPK